MRLKITLIAVIWLLGLIPGMAQPMPPDLRCISVESNGNVTLTWIAPADTGMDFNSYQIYYGATAAGPFVKVDSIFNYATVSYTITSVNASSTPIYFYIKTREGCCTYSSNSDTLKTIRMIATSLSNQTVRLNWNRTRIPPLSSTSPNFVLAKELSPGVYTSFKTLTDTFTTDTNYYCSKFINYRVTQADNSGCLSISSYDGEWFRDTQGPAATVIDTVSVDATSGLATISWEADTVPDTQGYVIYQFNGISYDSIGYVTGINNLFYTYAASLAGTMSESFSVAPYDSCRNLGALTPVHRTIYLTHVFSRCAANVSLQWSTYQNMEGGVIQYEVLVRENGGPWVIDGSVGPGVTTYNKQLTTQGALYEFLIRAVGGSGKTSSSNIVSEVADIYAQPDFLYIRRASIENGVVEIDCFVDTTGDITAYRLYHSQSGNQNYTLVQELPFNALPDLQFTDVTADTDFGPIWYKLTAVDSCGSELTVSNIAKTVFLEAEGGNDFISKLNWDDYQGFAGGVGSYGVYRVVNGVRQATPMILLSGTTHSFKHDVSAVQIDPGDNYCYVIQATEDSVNFYGFRDYAFSNEACAPQEPIIFVPNAFTPNGKNPYFMPVVLFDMPGTYTFRVMNRWGQTVFESDDPVTGWDGSYEGTASPVGLYVYQVVFRGYNLKELRKTGTVMLIR